MKIIFSLLFAWFIVSYTPYYVRAVSLSDALHQIAGTLGKNSIPHNRPAKDKYCFDFAGVVPEEVIKEVDDYGRSLKDDFDIDFVVVVVPSLEGRNIVSYTADLFSRWEIGERTKGKKGILILLSKKDQKVKIEVGYDLEPIYTDAYVGRVEREMLKEFLEQADWKRGFLATIENFIERTYYMQDKGINVKEITETTKMGYYSGGGGAKGTFDFGAALKKPLPKTPQELRRYFGAQASPKLAFQRYMEFCARNMKDYTVDLFNERTKTFFSYWPTSTGQRRSEAQEWDGLTYEVRQKGKWAAVFHPDDDYMKMAQHPVYFMEKTDKGWQMDLDAMARGLSYGGRFVHWVNGAALYPYVQLFMDDYTLEPNMFCLVKKSKGIGTFGIYFLGTGLYNPSEPGIHIALWDEKNADPSGLRTGDSIVAIDGKKVPEGREGERMVAKYLMDNVKAGDRHHLQVCRGLRFIEMDVEAASPPDAFKYFRKCLKTPRVWMGIYIGMTNEEEEKYAGVPSTVVLDVYPGSPAGKAGLKPGDIICKVNGKKGPYGELLPGQFLDILEKHKAGDKLNLQILRNLKKHKTATVVLDETLHKGYY